MWICPECEGKTGDEFNICWSCRSPRGGVAPQQEVLLRVIVSTTPALETHHIKKYLGPVFGEAILGTSILGDFFAAITDVVGGRSADYEFVLQRARVTAVRELAENAERCGANAVVGVSITYETIRQDMLMVCATGTAVSALPSTQDQPGIPD